MAGALWEKGSGVNEALYHFQKLFILCVWVFCLRVYLYTTCVSGAPRGKKRVLDPLGLELQTVVSHHVGTRK